MGTISSGIGLISGLDITNIVDQLIAIESRPRDMIAARVGRIDAQKSAFSEITARINELVSRIGALSTRSLFETNKIQSSDDSVLTATADTRVAPGSYNFIVRQLASSHQMVSRGFHTSDAQLSAGSLLIESARARVDSLTTLDELNGQRGVQRGAFELTDGAGNSVEIQTADAVTLSEVVERINASDLDIEARIRGDALELTETNGGSLTVREVDGGRTAQDLGFGPGNTFSSIGPLAATGSCGWTRRR